MKSKIHLQNAKKGMTREEKLFKKDPIWKSVLIMSIPSIILMLVFGSYFFFDSVLSINLAADSYKSDLLSATDKVRLYMNGYSPINSLMIAVSLLFGMGISTRVSINLGAGRKERAIGTIKSGNMFGLTIAIIMVPILIFTAKPWIGSQYSESIRGQVSEEAFRYAWPVIMSFPFIVFNQIISSLLRVEARNKQMLIALVSPIFINLFGDWLFMGPLGMGVEGGAWATFTSNIFTTLLLVIFILKTPKSAIVFKNMFGLKFRVLSIIGIALVGIAPFLRNMSQSITSTTQMQIVKDISASIYKGHFGVIKANDQGIMSILQNLISNPKQIPPLISNEWNSLLNAAPNHSISSLLTENKQNISNYSGMQNLFNLMTTRAFEQNFMTLIITGAMPVFALFFPVMFSLAQASRPIAAYNYGAKNYSRVKQTYWWTTLYATIAGLIIYFLVAWGISGPLMKLLKVDGYAYEKAKTVLKIIMLSLLGFSFGISGMVVLGSTDRIIFSIIASSMQGLILFWPVMFGLKEAAIATPSYEYLFWWGWPILTVGSSIIITIISAYVLHILPKKEQITLDDRITKINNWIYNKLPKSKKQKIN